METIAKHRHADFSAQKVRLVADLIRGKKISAGSGYFDLHQQESGCTGQKLLESAIANAEHNDGADIDKYESCENFRRRSPEHEAHYAACKRSCKSHPEAHQPHHCGCVQWLRLWRLAMGQKVHPNGIRRGYCKTMELYLVCEHKELADNLDSDFKVPSVPD